MFAFSALGVYFVLLSRSGNRILVVYSILLRAMEPRAHVAEKDKKPQVALPRDAYKPQERRPASVARPSHQQPQYSDSLVELSLSKSIHDPSGRSQGTIRLD